MLSPLAIAGSGFALQALSNLLMPGKSKLDQRAIDRAVSASYASGAQNVNRAVGSQNQITAARLAQAGLGSSGLLSEQVAQNEQVGQQQLQDLLGQLEMWRTQLLQRNAEFDALLRQKKLGGFGEIGGSLSDIGMLAFLLG